MRPLPFDYLVHADWSTRPEGRWRATARRWPGGWAIEPATPVGDLDTFIAGLIDESGAGAPLLGVDLPIGVPAAWATPAGVRDLLPAFRGEGPEGFGSAAWPDFYAVAEHVGEISLRRPFFPFRNGAKGEIKQAQLVSGLGVADMDALRRRCEFDEHGKRGATPLFWTIGPAQVGKAAIGFWRDVLGPALRADQASVWPFQGDLGGLARVGRVAVAETYPGEIYHWLDLSIIKPRRRKGRQEDRADDAERMIARGVRLKAHFSEAALAQIRSGFPDGKDDAFDAMVGLLGLLMVVEGKRAPGAPYDEEVRRIEGWILGRRASDIGRPPKRLE